MDGNQGPRRPVFPVRIVPLAALGARTNLGGTVVTATSDMVIDGMPLATVGDTVRHPTYGDTLITSGCDAIRSFDKPLACAGSLTGCEDEFIVDAGQCRVALVEYIDGRVLALTLAPEAFADGESRA